jgi:hypothetical protein
MRHSKMQEAVWRARDELGRELAGMSARQIERYAAGVLRDFEAQTGVRLPVYVSARGARTRKRKVRA